MVFKFKKSNKVAVQSRQRGSDSEYSEEQTQSSASSERKSSEKNGVSLSKRLTLGSRLIYSRNT